MEETSEYPLGNPRPRKRTPHKRSKVGKPRGPTCRWTSDLDELLKTAWFRGGLRAARRAIKQEQPTWSRYSIKKRAAALGLCRPKSKPWSEADVNHLLWSIDSNASLTLIAGRLGRTLAAVRKKLWDLGYKAESLGGYKVKEVAEMFGVLPGRIQYWVDEQMLLTKGGRITESSFSKFLSEFPEKIAYETLSPEMRGWLCEMGYPEQVETPKGEVANEREAGQRPSKTKYSSAANSQSVNDG